VSRPRKPVPEEIQALSRRIERWRRTRARRAPMPAELWDAAVAAARTHGVSAVVVPDKRMKEAWFLATSRADRSAAQTVKDYAG